MSRFDHARAAAAMANDAGFTSTVRGPVLAATAQVHATLALVEQQRIANLIALATGVDQYGDGIPRDVSSMAYRALVNARQEFHPDVAAALGIEVTP